MQVLETFNIYSTVWEQIALDVIKGCRVESQEHCRLTSFPNMIKAINSGWTGWKKFGWTGWKWEPVPKLNIWLGSAKKNFALVEKIKKILVDSGFEKCTSGNFTQNLTTYCLGSLGCVSCYFQRVDFMSKWIHFVLIMTG